MIKLYTSDGTLLGEFDVEDNSRRQSSLMGDDRLTLYHSRPTQYEFPLRCYCTFEGRIYRLFEPPEIRKVNTRNFVYTLIMYTDEHLLHITQMRNTIDGRVEFPLTATAREHLEYIVACLNVVDGGWTVDYANCIGMEQWAGGAYTGSDGLIYRDAGNEKMVSYQSVSCIDALKAVADTYNTEYLISGKKILLTQVEFYKKTQLLQMQYGYNLGFLSGNERHNETIAIDTLYVKGGEQNLCVYNPTLQKTEPYKVNDIVSKTLALPDGFTNGTSSKNASRFIFFNGENLYIRSRRKSINEYVWYDREGNRMSYAAPVANNGIGGERVCAYRAYVVTSDRRAIRQVVVMDDDGNYDYYRNSNIEACYDGSEVYPMRVGGVSEVRTTPKADETTGKIYNLYDIVDANDCPDYSLYSISEEVMTMIFQDGMLAGREFELNTTEGGEVICASDTCVIEGISYDARRFELCPSEEDNIIMPNDTFAPAVGDHYVVFHCGLPKSYVTEAEYRLLFESVAYLWNNGEHKYTFNGKVDMLWLRRTWATNADHFKIGAYIHLKDEELFGNSGLMMRITSITQGVNNVQDIQITVSNKPLQKIDWVKQMKKAVMGATTRPQVLRPNQYAFPQYRPSARMVKGASMSNSSTRMTYINSISGGGGEVDSLTNSDIINITIN